MCKIDRGSRTLGAMAELAAEIIRRFLLRSWQSNLPDYRRHFADTIPNKPAQMRGEREATSLAMWCRNRLRRDSATMACEKAADVLPCDL
jgi:hypothetical protein